MTIFVLANYAKYHMTVSWQFQNKEIELRGLYGSFPLVTIHPLMEGSIWFSHLTIVIFLNRVIVKIQSAFTSESQKTGLKDCLAALSSPFFQYTSFLLIYIPVRMCLLS